VGHYRRNALYHNNGDGSFTRSHGRPWRYRQLGRLPEHYDIIVSWIFFIANGASFRLKTMPSTITVAMETIGSK
jgi:hypothetical protein